MHKIFCVEDDTNIRELVEYTLNASGFSTEGFCCAKDFLIALESVHPDLILLDIMLPDKDGTELLKQLRENPETKGIPIIMLTARTGQLDKIKSLDGGADDYITKPFDILELISRINAVLRRSIPQSHTDILSYRTLVLNHKSHTVTADGQPVTLTYKEYELLRQLLTNSGMVLTRDHLMNLVWGTDFVGESRTVDVHIRTLRQKLGTAGTYIETVRNVGYKVG